jgi:hypothetical protein
MTEELNRYESSKRGVNTPRLHWPSIWAGVFVALTLFIISVLFARGCDVDITFRNAASTANEVGAILWGGAAALICFGIGAAVAGRNAVLSGRPSGFFNGMMVWAVSIPILMYGLNAGIGPRLGQTVAFGGGKGVLDTNLIAPQLGPAAVTAGARMGNENEQAPNNINQAGQAAWNAPETTGSPHTISHAQGAAWWTLCSIVLGFLAASVCGAVAGAIPKLT